MERTARLIIVMIAIMFGMAAPANACQLVCVITTAAYDGNLGGVAGANAKCNAEYAGFKFARSSSMVAGMPNMSADSRPHVLLAPVGGGGVWVGNGSFGTCLNWTDNGGVATGTTLQESGTSLPEGYRYSIGENSSGCSTGKRLLCCNM